LGVFVAKNLYLILFLFCSYVSNAKPLLDANLTSIVERQINFLTDGFVIDWEITEICSNGKLLGRLKYSHLAPEYCEIGDYMWMTVGYDEFIFDINTKNFVSSLRGAIITDNQSNDIINISDHLADVIQPIIFRCNDINFKSSKVAAFISLNQGFASTSPVLSCSSF
jgi:hypothetical protein